MTNYEYTEIQRRLSELADDKRLSRVGIPPGRRSRGDNYYVGDFVLGKHYIRGADKLIHKSKYGLPRDFYDCDVSNGSCLYLTRLRFSRALERR